MIKATYAINAIKNYPELTRGESYDVVCIKNNRVYLRGLRGYDIVNFLFPTHEVIKDQFYN